MKSLKLLDYGIISLLLGIVTVLFFLLGPADKDGVFYFNLMLAYLITIFFFGSVIVQSKKKKRSARSNTITKYLMLYSLLSACFMIIREITHLCTPMPLKWYFAGILAIFFIFAILIIHAFQKGKNGKEKKQG